MEPSIADIHNAMHAGTLTCHNLVQQYLDRIHAYDQQGPAINSMLHLNPASLQQADAMDQEFKRTQKLKPLACIPIVLKDNFELHPRAVPTPFHHIKSFHHTDILRQHGCDLELVGKMLPRPTFPRAFPSQR
jgi:hypothetical protein